MKIQKIYYQERSIMINDEPRITQRRLVRYLLDNLIHILLTEKKIIFKKTPKSEIKDE